MSRFACQWERTFALCSVVLLTGFRLPAQDCNDNGVDDALDLERRVRGFSAAPGYPAGTQGQSTASADFDGDGDIDFVTANGSAHRGGEHESLDTLSLLLNRGNGTFDTPVPIELGETALIEHVVAGDYDGDGEQDLAASGWRPATSSYHSWVFLNAGNASFAAKGGFDDSAKKAADLDGDGDDELLSADINNPSSNGRTWLSNGDGTFVEGPRIPIRAGEDPILLETADMDGDGDVDVVTSSVTCCPSRSFVTVFENTGGSFADGIEYADIPHSLALVDFDRDGDVDVLSASRLLENQGDGTLVETRTLSESGTTAEDLDSDGDIDLLRSSCRGEVFVSLQSEARSFETAVYLVRPAPRSLVVVDLDGDGRKDIAVTSSLGGRLCTDLLDTEAATLSVLRNVGAGVFEAPRQFDVEVGGPGVERATYADLDGDGDIDIAQSVTTPHGGRLFLSFGDGSGRFGEAVDLEAPDRGYVLPGSHQLLATDFDGDGDADLAFQELPTLDEPATMVVVLNDGDWRSVRRIARELPWPTVARQLEVGDFNRDGLPDLHGGSFLLLNDGDGTFRVSPGHGRVAGDLDNSGTDDFVVLTETEVHVCLTTRDGNVGERLIMNLVSTWIDLTSGDFDGDGHEDLIGLLAEGGVSFLAGTGDGRFVEPVLVTALEGVEWSDLAAADVDLDGDLDLAVSREETGEIRLLENDRAGGFSLAGPPIVTAFAENLGQFVDFDGDGDLELLRRREVHEIVLESTSLDVNRNAIPDECEASFRRGDCDGDGQVEGQVTDAVFLLNHNFFAGREPPCLAACDANGDGRAEGQVTDAIYLLNYNFLFGPPPAQPFPDCGPALLATDDQLGCEISTTCD